MWPFPNMKLTKENVRLLEAHAKDFEDVMCALADLLASNGLLAQEKVMRDILEMFRSKNYGLLIKKMNSVDLWGGSGAVWEVYMANNHDMQRFELNIIALINLMEKTKILRVAGIKRIRSLFDTRR